MRIIGIDPSSKKIALACWSEAEPREWALRTFETSQKDRAFAIAELHDAYTSFVKSLDPAEETYVFVERPLVGRGGVQSTVVIVQVQGMCLSSAVQFVARGAYEAHTSTWKKAVVGRGNASKQDIQEWLREREPDLFAVAEGDQDLMDAVCIALYGREVVERAQRL